MVFVSTKTEDRRSRSRAKFDEINENSLSRDSSAFDRNLKWRLCRKLEPITVNNLAELWALFRQMPFVRHFGDFIRMLRV